MFERLFTLFQNNLILPFKLQEEKRKKKRGIYIVKVFPSFFNLME